MTDRELGFSYRKLLSSLFALGCLSVCPDNVIKWYHKLCSTRFAPKCVCVGVVVLPAGRLVGSPILQLTVSPLLKSDQTAVVLDIPRVIFYFLFWPANHRVVAESDKFIGRSGLFIGLHLNRRPIKQCPPGTWSWLVGAISTAAAGRI